MSEARELHDALAILATFGELCTYTPKDGEARDITAVIDESRALSEVDRQLTSQGRLTVYALKDKDHETYGGIDEPQIGDVIETSRYAGKLFSWSGEEIRSDRVSHELGFQRDLPYEIGGNRR